MEKDAGQTLDDTGHCRELRSPREGGGDRFRAAGYILATWLGCPHPAGSGAGDCFPPAGGVGGVIKEETGRRKT